jgi:uncharacterized protein (TIGR00251 family)
MPEMFQDEQPAQPANTARGGNVRLSPVCLIRVKVVPGSRKDEIVGALGDELKIKVSAPPEAGAANARVCELLADALGVSLRDVTLASGATTPHKVIRASGITAWTAKLKLLSASC